LGAKLQGRIMETWLRGQRVYSGEGFEENPRGEELVRR